MAKLKGSNAKNAKARVAGSSQVGRFGCRSASHTSRRSLRLIRQTFNILRIMPSLGFACLCSTSPIESRSARLGSDRFGGGKTGRVDVDTGFLSSEQRRET